MKKIILFFSFSLLGLIFLFAQSQQPPPPPPHSHPQHTTSAHHNNAAQQKMMADSVLIADSLQAVFNAQNAGAHHRTPPRKPKPTPHNSAVISSPKQ